jgi:hypothetical protein
MGSRIARWLEPWRERRQRTVALGRLLHHRYSRLFWALHSAWALVTGVVVLILAHNRYGFLPWVVLFIGLTWASTLFFSRLAAGSDSPRLRFAQGFVSYLTRVMYQETLFFLLPFYFYSTTVPSWNCFYVIALAGLAVLSCSDLLFDRLMREWRGFAVGFFMFVTFSALQFFLPLILRVRIHNGAYLAIVVSLLAALPLAYSWEDLKQRGRQIRVLVALVLVVFALKLFRVLVPPVPLRLTVMRLSDRIDPKTLALGNDLAGTIATSQLANGRLVARATVFAPSRLPTKIQFRYTRDGDVLRTSRGLDFQAHDKGFRVWDVLRAGKGGFAPGKYTIEVWTTEGQLIGREVLRVVASPSGAAPAPTKVNAKKRS